MTINVVVKCPDGVVMGADSMVTLYTDGGRTVTSIIPYYSKLYPIGQFAAGAMLNGDGTLGGRTVEDIIAEFSQGYLKKHSSKNYSLYQLALALRRKIDDLIHSKPRSEIFPVFEIIIGGYSRGKKAYGRRYGEIYSLVHIDPSTHSTQLRERYNKDTKFGTHYGGQILGLDRFLFGIDDRMVRTMLLRRGELFAQVKDYIINDLRMRGINVPDDIIINDPGVRGFDIFRLISDYEPVHSGKGRLGETLKNIKRGVIGKLETMEGFFSLQTAVNYCSFLMSCAYAESAFTFAIPSVGSEMRVASVTRDEGFKFRKIWEIQAPGPPFR